MLENGRAFIFNRCRSIIKVWDLIPFSGVKHLIGWDISLDSPLPTSPCEGNGYWEGGSSALLNYYLRVSFVFRARGRENLTCHSKQAHLLQMKVWLVCNDISDCTFSDVKRANKEGVLETFRNACHRTRKWEAKCRKRDILVKRCVRNRLKCTVMLFSRNLSFQEHYFQLYANRSTWVYI